MQIVAVGIVFYILCNDNIGSLAFYWCLTDFCNSLVQKWPATFMNQSIMHNNFFLFFPRFSRCNKRQYLLIAYKLVSSLFLPAWQWGSQSWFLWKSIETEAVVKLSTPCKYSSSVVGTVHKVKIYLGKNCSTCYTSIYFTERKIYPQVHKLLFEIRKTN